MYRTFIYTPRSGSRIVSPTRGNNNLIAVHTLRNKSHVVWSRFPILELIREKHLASKEARFQLCDVLMQQCTNAIIIDNCGEISVISHDWTEWYHLLRLCSALGIPTKIGQEHALQALATGLGAFHESLGYVGPHPDPKMALDFSQPFPLHPQVVEHTLPAGTENLDLSEFAEEMKSAKWCAIGLFEASAEIAEEAGLDLATTPKFNYEDGVEVFSLPVATIFGSVVANQKYQDCLAQLHGWLKDTWEAHKTMPVPPVEVRSAFKDYEEYED